MAKQKRSSNSNKRTGGYKSLLRYYSPVTFVFLCLISPALSVYIAASIGKFIREAHGTPPVESYSTFVGFSEFRAFSTIYMSIYIYAFICYIVSLYGIKTTKTKKRLFNIGVIALLIGALMTIYLFSAFAVKVPVQGMQFNF